MRSDVTRRRESTILAVVVPTLHVAFELGATTWKLASTTGLGQAPRLRTVPARNLTRVAEELTRAKARFHLAPDAPVVSCYEAGPDGFWLHHALTAAAVRNHVVDSASIAVNRRQRRAKSDRLDARKLVAMLVRYAEGERSVWHVVRVPSSAAEDQRQLHRELKTVHRERLATLTRVESLLVTQGVGGGFSGRESVAQVAARVASLTRWDGTLLPLGLQARLGREWGQVVSLTMHQRTRGGAHATAAPRRLAGGSASAAAHAAPGRRRGHGVGLRDGVVCVAHVSEPPGFGGALLGLVPTPYQSGTGHRELGISKAGNRWVRAVAIEGAWCWLRYQPQSELSQWFLRRFATGGSRQRRIGIVALARKLVTALEQYLRLGMPPAGALMRA